MSQIGDVYSEFQRLRERLLVYSLMSPVVFRIPVEYIDECSTHRDELREKIGSVRCVIWMERYFQLETAGPSGSFVTSELDAK